MTTRPMRWRAAILLLVALLGLGIGTQLGIKPAAATHPHAAPVLVAPGHTLPSVTAEHPHLRDNSIPSAPDLMIGLPRSTSTLLALGLALAVCVAMVCWCALTPVTSRGPPRQVAAIHTGRAVLTRLCISRR
ncbi:hypothetical protein ACJH6H_08960 [Mycobacterium sp. SMC-21]|uniref:hypothetical protein n=1 Tax=unclassified Mycobacterium TaxID=2642494 RepID=UPI003204C95C